MEPVPNATVFIVDDDASVREALAWLLRSRRLPSESFESAEAFDAMLHFTAEAVKNVPHVVMTVVSTMPAEDIEACRKLCENAGAKFRVREYISE